jgi:hypothetical protein
MAFAKPNQCLEYLAIIVAKPRTVLSTCSASAKIKLPDLCQIKGFQYSTKLLLKKFG